MKPFNLEKALQGEPVLLRDGRKGLVFYRIPDQYLFYKEKGEVVYKLRGITLDKEGFIDEINACWTLDGDYDTDFGNSNDDIIGMWEEPRLTIPELMEKALNEGRIIKAEVFGLHHPGFKVIAKTKDGSDYVLQFANGEKAQVYLQSVLSAVDADWSIA